MVYQMSNVTGITSAEQDIGVRFWKPLNRQKDTVSLGRVP